jgi:hypothetical protein
MPTHIRQPPTANPDCESALPRRALALTVVVGNLALTVAGCGGSSSAGPGSSPATFTVAAFKFARCMRDHGLPLFPDPAMTDHNGQPIAYLPTPNSVAASPGFKRANTVCQKILTPTLDPTQSAAVKEAREQHLTAFPDPNSQGQLSQQMIINARVDLHAPAAVAAAKECLPSAGGAITAGQVGRAVSGT